MSRTIRVLPLQRKSRYFQAYVTSCFASSITRFFLQSPRQGYAVRTDGGIVAQRRPPIPIGSRKPEPPGAGGYNWHKQSNQIRNESRGPSSMSIVVEEVTLLGVNLV